MSLRILPRAFSQPLRYFVTRATCSRARPNFATRGALARGLSTTPIQRDRSFTNLLADEIPPPVQVSSITDEGILLADGLLLPSSCIFLDGHVFLWDVPQKLWEGWGPERFEFFEATLSRPGLYSVLRPWRIFIVVIIEILVLGTGRTLVQPPPFIRSYFNKLGIQLDVMDTVSYSLHPYVFPGSLKIQRNACATYNLLAEEGRRVAAALLPLTPQAWHKVKLPTRNTQ